MKLLHTSDLHLGKTLHNFSMLEDQEHVLEEIYGIALAEKADGLLLAGDIYDRSVPSKEAVMVLDEFLTKALVAGMFVILVSGNHDSPERLSFAEHILEKQGLYIAGTWDGALKRISLTDAYGTVLFDCLPFFNPEQAGFSTSNEAVAAALETKKAGDTEKEGEETARRVLITHYFVTSAGKEPVLSDSETMVHVGGLDNVDASLFAAYDYVALGHIHRPQKIGENAVYYAGAPLAYSFSEAGNEKSVNLITLEKRGEVKVEKKKLTPLHEVRKIKGTLLQIMEAAGKKKEYAYVQVTLTDERELAYPVDTLRTAYPNLMQLIFSKNQIEKSEKIKESGSLKKRTPLEMFRDFYELIKQKTPDEEQMKAVTEAMREAEVEGE